MGLHFDCDIVALAIISIIQCMCHHVMAILVLLYYKGLSCLKKLKQRETMCKILWQCIRSKINDWN